MSEKWHPDGKRTDDWDYDPEDEDNLENDVDDVDDDLRLWGSPAEDEKYGEARDISFQAGTTSRPGSMGKKSEKERGWRGQDGQRQGESGQEKQQSHVSQQGRREKDIRRTTKNTTP